MLHKDKLQCYTITKGFNIIIVVDPADVKIQWCLLHLTRRVDVLPSKNQVLASYIHKSHYCLFTAIVKNIQ